jgi:branched-chain amino acid transport system ATP-binding protein
MLDIEGLSAGYYGSNVLKNVSLSCGDEITLVIGPNGAGKSTLVKSITGTLRPVKGKIFFDGTEIQNQKAFDIFRRGITTVPERGRVFREMTVLDNLKFALESAGSKENGSFERRLDSVMELFPDLKENLGKMAGKLSGGQQQMLSIARALVTEPKFLIMDEPTTGLYPKLLKELLVKIKTISRNLPVLLTEQNVSETVPLAKKVYLIEAGKIVASGSSEDMMKNEIVRRSYLGQMERREDKG